MLFSLQFVGSGVFGVEAQTTMGVWVVVVRGSSGGVPVHITHHHPMIYAIVSLYLIFNKMNNLDLFLLLLFLGGGSSGSRFSACNTFERMKQRAPEHVPGSAREQTTRAIK